MKFERLGTSGAARRGRLSFARGVVETPAFMPVGTYGTVKGMLPRDIEAIGTNAHELPMVYAALARDDTELARAPYDVLADWHEEHDGNLRIILPDTYGTAGFLRNAPDWFAGWTGIRIDSGQPEAGAEAAIDWWKSRGEDPTQKLVPGASPL